MAAGVADDVVLTALSGEAPIADGSASSLASRLAAVVGTGRMFAQLATTAKLAVLYGDDSYVDAALRNAGDLCAVIRRIGASAEERDELEALAVRFLLDLRRELAPKTIISRRECAIRLVVDDGDDELQGSPHDERSIGNLTIAMVDAVCAEFIGALYSGLPVDFQQWLDLALHVQATLYPPRLVDLVFPDNSESMRTMSENHDEGQIDGDWLSTALSCHRAPQRIDLASESLDYSWLKLTIQRTRELGVIVPEVLNQAGNSVTRLTAVDSVFAAIDSRIGAPPEDTVSPESTECATHVVAAAPSRLGEVSAPQQTLARMLGVLVDQKRKRLSRSICRKEVLFPNKNLFLWRLAIFLLSANAEGRTTATIRENWKALGGKKVDPAQGTIANAVWKINLLLEHLGLEAGRPHHNRPWTVIDFAPKRIGDKS